MIPSQHLQSACHIPVSSTSLANASKIDSDTSKPVYPHPTPENRLWGRINRKTPHIRRVSIRINFSSYMGGQ